MPKHRRSERGANVKQNNYPSPNYSVQSNESMNEIIKDEASELSLSACGPCKTNHKKCNRVLPVCSECKAHGRSCYYPIKSPKSKQIVSHSSPKSTSFPTS